MKWLLYWMRYAVCRIYMSKHHQMINFHTYYIEPLESHLNCHGLHFHISECIDDDDDFIMRHLLTANLLYNFAARMDYRNATHRLSLQHITRTHFKWQMAMLNRCICNRCFLLHIDVEVRCVHNVHVRTTCHVFWKSKMSHSIWTEHSQCTHQLQFIQICVEMAFRFRNIMAVGSIISPRPNQSSDIWYKSYIEHVIIYVYYTVQELLQVTCSFR